MKTVLLGATFIVATAAFAQTSPAPSTAATDQPVTLDELVVSGKDLSSFRSESVQLGTFRDMNPVDVPMTVNAVTQDVIQAQQDQGLFGALRNTAGVSLYELGGATYANIAVRGISLQNRTNFRLNGALPLINLIEYPLEAVDRVEVLKGAAALYYGYVTPSGVVDYVTKRPAQQPIESATFSVNGYGAYGGNIDVSERANTGREGYVGIRVNAGAFKMNPGVNNYDGYRDFVTIAADWRISDRVLMRFDYLHVKEAVTEISYLSLPIVGGAALVPPPPPTSFNMASSWMKSNQFANAGLFRTDIILTRNWTILAEAGVSNLQRARNNDSFSITNINTGAGTLSVPYAKAQRYLNRNGRVELYGRFATGPVSHNLSIGVTGNQQQQDSPSAPSLKYADNFYNPIPILQSDANLVPVPHQYNPIRDYGPYFVERMSILDDRIQAVGGARYEEYYNAAGPSYPFPPTGVFRAAGWAPGASLVFKPVADASIYASYMSGLEESGIAPANTANAYQVLPPLQSTQYEVGAKAQVLGGMLLQLGAFELRHPGTFINSANFDVPNGLTKSQGLELSASGEVVPSLSLIGSALLMTDRQTNAANPATYGLQTEDTPKQTLSLFADWHTPLTGLDVSAGAYYSGRKSVDNTDQGWVGGYTMYSAGAGYAFRVGRGRYDLRAACDNLTNKRAWTSAGANLLSSALPRVVRLSVTATY
jgi:iron complex outermembrane receptor protein